MDDRRKKLILFAGFMLQLSLFCYWRSQRQVNHIDLGGHRFEDGLTTLHSDQEFLEHIRPFFNILFASTMIFNGLWLVLKVLGYDLVDCIFDPLSQPPSVNPTVVSR